MDYRAEFEQGQTFDQFLADAQANAQLWHGIYERVEPHQPAVERARAYAGNRKLLVINEDWCGDAVNIVPHVARLADAAGIALRVIGRDAHPAVMDAHLTRGSRSIPIVIALDENYRELGWWGPRPRALQQWFYDEGKAMAPGDRYRELRRWYALDRGRTIANEVVELLSTASRAVA